MAARPADNSASRPRPRPVQPAVALSAAPEPESGSTSGSTSKARTGSGTRTRAADSPRRRQPARRPTGRGVARQQQPQSQQMVAAAGNAVLVAARAGRLLGRTGWRLARQIPVVGVVEAQAQRLGHAVGTEFARLLDMPQAVFAAATPEEQRALALIQNAATEKEPLRSAMTELLDRAAERDGTRSRDYLYGTIVSQLVPDEARILAALAGGTRFAALDVLGKSNGRSGGHVELANASTVGAAAQVSLLDNTGTYLSRLLNFGLIEFGPAEDSLDSQFDLLRDDPSVQRARAVDGGKGRTVRKSVGLSAFGVEFWSACAPTSRPAR